MNKALAAATLSALMATAASANQTQPTAADTCMDKVFTTIETDLTAILNDVVTGFGAHYSEEQVNTFAFVCEASTDSKLTDASSQYMDQDGYSLEVSAP